MAFEKYKPRGLFLDFYGNFTKLYISNAVKSLSWCGLLDKYNPIFRK